MSRISNKSTFISHSFFSFIHSFNTRRRRLTQNYITHIHLKISSQAFTEDSSVQRRGRALCSSLDNKFSFISVIILVHVKTREVRPTQKCFPWTKARWFLKTLYRQRKFPCCRYRNISFKREKKKKEQPPRWPSPAAPDDEVIKL